MRNRIDDRLQREVLQRWTSRVVQLKERLIEVSEQRDIALVSNAVEVWRYALHRAREDKRTVEHFQRQRAKGE